MIERRLLSELAGGAAVSALAGAMLWATGRRGAGPDLAAFGRQTMGWAAVNGALATGGWVAAARRRDEEPDEVSRARTLRRVLLVNAGLDVGYIAGGLALARDPRHRGDGAAIVVQGAFLLWLDARHARRFGRAGPW